jgi:general L-amino acid transport system substrate-binding protein
MMGFSIRTAATGIVAVIIAWAGCAGAVSAQTLKQVRDRGELVCGVSQGLLGFSSQDAAGKWSGFDVDFCRALSAAIFNDPGKVRFVPLSAAERFAALSEGKIDVLSRNSTWTLEREAGLKLLFAGISFHDGQGFMVPGNTNAVSALDLKGATVCVQAGTTSQANAADYFRANGMTVTLKTFPTAAETLTAYGAGQCNAFTSDQSALYAERLKLPKPADHTILPDVISKEPLGPVVRQDDMGWFLVVRWTLAALINAEELGVSSKTTEEAMASQKPDVRRFTGADGAFGEKLGLPADFAIRMVRAVGNYGEIFERNVGVTTPLGIPRGMNHLWSLGGVLYAPPMR